MPYLVFHDAYQYLEQRYGLRALGAVALDAGQRPGARHVRHLRQLIRERQVRCLFTEPQFEPRLLNTLLEDMTVGTGQLDPMGADIPPGPGLYAALMRSLADSLRSCLGRS